MSGAKPDIFVFDVGNVLIEVDMARVTAAWAAAAGVPHERVASRFAADEYYCRHETGELDDSGYFAYLRERLGITLSDEAFLAGWNEVFVRPVPGMEAVLQDLASRHPLYGFSNTNKSHVAHFKPRYARLLSPLRDIYCSCDMGCRKPTAQAFAEVSRRIGAAPERIAFFDDLAENVAAAQRAGMLGFQVSSAAEVREAVASLGVPVTGSS